MKKRINLDELENRVKVLGKPTPQQVVNLITVMYRELTNPEYIHTTSIGLGRLDEPLYARV